MARPTGPATTRPFGPPERSACQHTFVFRELGGVAFRACESCGMTHLLWQFDNGEMALLPVTEQGEDGWERVREEKEERAEERDREDGEEVDDDVADLVEDLSSLS